MGANYHEGLSNQRPPGQGHAGPQPARQACGLARCIRARCLAFAGGRDSPEPPFQGATMGPIRLLAAPIRRIANSRLFQLAVVVTIILLLDHYSYDYAPLRPVTEGLKKSVTATIDLVSQYFRVGVLTDPVLQVGLLITYVYI